MIEPTNEKNTTIQNIYRQLGISARVYRFCQEILQQLQLRFEEIDQNTEYNQLTVKLAFWELLVTVIMILAERHWKQCMHLFFTRKMRWLDHRLLVGHMRWRWR